MVDPGDRHGDGGHCEHLHQVVMDHRRDSPGQRSTRCEDVAGQMVDSSGSPVSDCATSQFRALTSLAVRCRAVRATWLDAARSVDNGSSIVDPETNGQRTRAGEACSFVVATCHPDGMGTRECPPWCARHSPARCRSDPEVVIWRLGALHCEFGVQLEAWAGRETALVLLPESAAPIYLPRAAAVGLGGVYGGLLAAAGWAASGLLPGSPEAGSNADPTG